MSSSYRGARETRLVIQIDNGGATSGPIARELQQSMEAARTGKSNKAKF